MTCRWNGCAADGFDAGRHYLVLEYVAGQTLAEMLIASTDGEMEKVFLLCSGK